MGFLSVFLFGIGLSADAASVAVCEGVKLRGQNLRLCFKIALFFGFFQMLMPLIGFYLGDLMVRIPFLSGAVGWIAFALLFFVSVKMIYEALTEQEEDCCCCEKPRATTQELLLLAVATSIDAMTVGVTFAANPPSLGARGDDRNILIASGIIGLVTFVLSFFSALFGHVIGDKLGKKAEILGGAVLLLLSAKIFLENLGISLPF